jgi:Protein of unknown function (DUF1559)
VRRGDLFGDGIFYEVNLDLVPNAGARIADVTDGLSNTAAFSEIPARRRRDRTGRAG